MKVQLEKTYPMPASAETAWRLLQDIEAVAGCMPGAKITERTDAQHYKGTVSVKLGPASMSFRGNIEVSALDAASKTLRLVAKGTDTSGSSAASMDLTARVEAIDATNCNLVGTSEVSMSGKAATFGGRVMGTVADQVLNQFAANFAARVQALHAQIAVSVASVAPALEARATPAAAPPVAPAATQPNQLNALALAWAVAKDWLRSLFGAKKA